MRILAIGDIGVIDGMMHVGDEAMFEQFVVQARARGIDDLVAISSNPQETAARYGIEAIARNTATLAGADAVVITGAGNLASTWPVHIAERLALAELAAHAQVPLVITGQTLGPFLTSDDERSLAQLLAVARLVGVRESASHALAARLGVAPGRLHEGADDASFLGLAAGEHPATKPYLLVSLASHVGAADRDAFVDATAALLDRLAALTGLEVVFLAHFGPLTAPWQRGDVVMHDRVIERMTSPARSVPTGTPVEAARLARSASFVVTSRYHPAVFAAPAGVPTLGIAVDEYTTVKLRGALGNFGQTSVISAEQLLAGFDPGPVWAERELTRSTGVGLAVTRRRDSDDWWDRVFGVVSMV